MLPVLHAITLWSGAAAAALLSATWQGLILVSCIALCLRLLPSPTAAGRSLLWMAGFLIVVLLHFSSLIAQNASHAGSAHVAALRLSPVWALAVAAIWALLSIYRAARLGAGAWSLRRIAQRATPTTSDAACTALLSSARRPVELCLSHDVDRPSVIGFRSPRILLPPALLAELSPSELEQVILHEIEHLRRADDWTNLVQKLVLVFFPLNPVLLWIEHRLCTERELACDDGVLRQTHARKAYASCLTHLAEHSVLRQAATLALGAWERQSELSRRVYRILRQPEAGFTTRHANWVTALLAVVLLTGTGELARSPQLVRFAAQPATAALASIPQTALLTPTAHLVLAKAVIPQPSSLAVPTHPRARTTILTRPIHRPLPGLHAVSAHAARPRTPWVVLTSFRRPYGSRSLAMPQDISPAYAAVPVADGWLIIQL
jgi:beta-lactamase regulating signal transducer with metallopeptidase domain